MHQPRRGFERDSAVRLWEWLIFRYPHEVASDGEGGLRVLLHEWYSQDIGMLRLILDNIDWRNALSNSPGQ